MAPRSSAATIPGWTEKTRRLGYSRGGLVSCPLDGYGLEGVGETTGMKTLTDADHGEFAG